MLGGADDIAEIVSCLSKNDAYATFFTVGDWVKKYPEAIKLIKEAGLEIRKSLF